MMPTPAIFNDGSGEIKCQILRRGAKNTRVLVGEDNRLVPTRFVTEMPDVSKNFGELIIPKTPLEMLYRSMRNDTGGKQAQFDSIVSRLQGRHGASGGDFLAELFRRSCLHSAAYKNLEENFHPDRILRSGDDQKFAADLVSTWDKLGKVSIEDTDLIFVDFEIFPFRTSLTCTERGESGRSTASGGMDLLLASQKNGNTRPMVGEVKAKSETVGPTFALIQVLMYASQIATLNQFKRIEKHYPKELNGISDLTRPEVEIILLLESGSTYADGDLDFFFKTSREFKKCADKYEEVRVSEIRVFDCEVNESSIALKQILN